MKRLFLFIFVLACSAYAQNVRVSIPFSSISNGSTPFLVANVPPNSPKLAVCSSPANGTPCTNYVTTYTGAGIACPNGAQDTPEPGALTSACQSTGDAQGNLGFWTLPGRYDYTVCVGTTCFGPYTVTVGAGTNNGCSGGTCLLIPPGAGIVTANGVDGNTTNATAANVIGALGYTAANDANVVHLTGAENVGGVKTFTADAAFNGNINVFGNFNLLGSGNLLLSGKQQVVTPTVPVTQDYSLYVKGGVFNCLMSSGASCSPSGVPAGITYVNPIQLTWSQTFTSGMNLTGCPTGVACPTQTVTLTTCPAGGDTKTGLYQTYIADGVNGNEAVTITGGTCTLAGGTSGTMTFVPFFSHTSYTFGAASSGIQETINNACGISIVQPYYNSQCNVTIPANGPYLSGSNWSVNNYNVYGTIFFHANQSVLSGYGVSINCMGTIRGPCLQIGDRVSSLNYAHNTVSGITFRTPVDVSAIAAYAGVQVATTASSGSVITETTAVSHTFRPKDMVVTLFTDDPAYWGDAIISTVPSSTTFTSGLGGTLPFTSSQNTPGVVALEYCAILDNGNDTHFYDIRYDQTGNAGAFNNFFDFWDDEGAIVDDLQTGGAGLNRNLNWAGSYIFAAGAQVSQTIAPVITVKNSDITAGGSNGVTVLLSNSVNIEDTVIQATSLWQVYVSTTRGGFQGVTLQNVYPESGVQVNPLSPAKTPFPGLGVAGLIADRMAGSSNVRVVGNSGIAGAFPSGTAPIPTGVPLSSNVVSVNGAGVYTATITFTGLIVNSTVSVTGFTNSNNNVTNAIVCAINGGATTISLSITSCPTLASTTSETKAANVAGSTPFTYYIVANDTTLNTQTSPMQILNWTSTLSDSIPVRWPRVANGTDTITYDVIRMTTPSVIGSIPTYPYYSGSGTTGCPGGAVGICGYVALGITQATACNVAGVPTLVCTYIDTGSSTTTAYLVKQGTYGNNANGAAGHMNFWPGSLVSLNKTATVDVEAYPVVGIGLYGNPIQVANQCLNYGVASPGGYTTCMASRTDPSNNPNQTATILSDGPAFGGGTVGVVKGRLNFSQTASTTLAPHHLITLCDSQPGLTQALATYRPLASVNDCFIGTDVAAGTALNLGQLSFGAPVALTRYIGQVGDGVTANWLERLTATMETFKVPVALVETTAPSGVANQDVCYGDSTAHAKKCSYNNGTFFRMPQVIATGATALGTGAISSATCATSVTGTATGATTASIVHWSMASDPNAITGYAGSATGAVLQIYAFPTSNTVNFRVCNNTSGSITPSAMSVNWDVTQ